MACRGAVWVVCMVFLLMQIACGREQPDATPTVSSTPGAQRIITIGKRSDKPADIIDKSQLPSDTIAIGAKVVLEDLRRGGTFDYLLVGEGETRDDIDTVSVTSPLGQALIGHAAGDEVEFSGPRGTLCYKVVSFGYE